MRVRSVAFAGRGEAEVQQQHPPLGRHHQIRGLQIAVDHAAAVGVLERFGHLTREAEAGVGPATLERVARGRARIVGFCGIMGSLGDRGREAPPAQLAGIAPRERKQHIGDAAPATCSIAK